jgi:hypothetical protein
MTDVSFAVMSLLMAAGLVLVAMKALPLFTGRALIFAGAAILCVHAIGIRIVAPISPAAADVLSWIAFFLMAAMTVFLSVRGLVRIIQKERSPASEAAS